MPIELKFEYFEKRMPRQVWRLSAVDDLPYPFPNKRRLLQLWNEAVGDAAVAYNARVSTHTANAVLMSFAQTPELGHRKAFLKAVREEVQK